MNRKKTETVKQELDRPKYEFNVIISILFAHNQHPFPDGAFLAYISVFFSIVKENKNEKKTTPTGAETLGGGGEVVEEGRKIVDL